MGEIGKGKPKKITWRKRVVFLVILAVLFLVVAECGLRITKAVIRFRSTAAGEENDCQSIVFLYIGDSITYGIGAGQAESYPRQMLDLFRDLHPQVPVKIYNVSMGGLNTSEGLDMLRIFNERNPQAAPDFAIILLGLNNRWNLHGATFWEWEPGVKEENYSEYLAGKLQLDKAFKVAKENAVSLISKARRTTRVKYHRLLFSHGWDVFFKSFQEDLLIRWIEHDLLQLTQRLRELKIEPLILTYHFPIFPGLNPLIRETAAKAETPLIDVEKPEWYYHNSNMFDMDRIHLNAVGYRDLARRITERFDVLYAEAEITARLNSKQKSVRCK